MTSEATGFPIVLPDPCLVVLVGAAGAGKSTFAASHFDAADTLSSDAFRAAISGDASDQAATRPAFAALHRSLARRSAQGRSSVVDATNVRTADRRALLQRVAAVGLPTVAIVLDLPLEVILARNAARSRTVGVAVIERQIAHLRASLAGPHRAIDGEGFDAVIVLDDPAVIDRVTIDRRVRVP